jgi:hypothetical protein
MHENSIAGVVAQPIINLLEVIQIHDNHGEHIVLPVGCSGEVREDPFELPPVVKSGQFIGGGHPL